MFRPSPQTTIQFILERSTLDIPPPGWAAPSQFRHLTGILRITIPQKAAPLKADKISIDLYGTMNGVRDSKRALSNTAGTLLTGMSPQQLFDEGMVDMTFVVWQPKDDVELEVGLSAGIHDFPFSVTVPMNILPTYNVHIRPNFSTSSQNGTDPSSMAEDRGRVGRGATLNGEFHVKLTVPRLAFVEDGFASILVNIQDGTCSTKNITGVKCILTETSSYKRSKGSSSTTARIGTLMQYPWTPPKTDGVADSTKTPLEIVVSIKDAKADLSTTILAVEHAILLQIEHRVQVSDSAYRTVLASFGLDPASPNSHTPTPSAPQKKVLFDEQLDIIVPQRQFFFSRDSKTPSRSSSTGSSAAVAINPSFSLPSTSQIERPIVPTLPSARHHQVDFEARLLAHQSMSQRSLSGAAVSTKPTNPASGSNASTHSNNLSSSSAAPSPIYAPLSNATPIGSIEAVPAPSSPTTSFSYAPSVMLSANGAPSVMLAGQDVERASIRSFSFRSSHAPSINGDHPSFEGVGMTPADLVANGAKPAEDLVTLLMDAQLTVPIRVVHAAHDDDEAMIALAPVEGGTSTGTTASAPASTSSSTSGNGTPTASAAAGSQASLFTRQASPHSSNHPHRLQLESSFLGGPGIGGGAPSDVSSLYNGAVGTHTGTGRASIPSPLQSSAASFVSRQMTPGTSSALAHHMSWYLANAGGAGTTSSAVSSSAASTYSSHGMLSRTPTWSSLPRGPSTGPGNTAGGAGSLGPTTLVGISSSSSVASLALAAAGLAHPHANSAKPPTSVPPVHDAHAALSSVSPPLLAAAAAVAAANAKPRGGGPPSPSLAPAMTPEDEVVVHEPVETPYVCVSGYEPTGTCTDGEELKIRAGDHVIVSDIFDDGWAVGTNLNTSTAGFFLVSKVTFDRTLAEPASRMGSALKEEDEEAAAAIALEDPAIPAPPPSVSAAPAPPVVASASANGGMTFPLASIIAQPAPGGASPIPSAGTTANAAAAAAALVAAANNSASVAVNPGVFAAIPPTPQSLATGTIGPSGNANASVTADRDQVMQLQAQIEQMRLMMERMEVSLKLATAAAAAASAPPTTTGLPPSVQQVLSQPAPVVSAQPTATPPVMPNLGLMNAAAGGMLVGAPAAGPAVAPGGGTAVPDLQALLAAAQLNPALLWNLQLAAGNIGGGGAAMAPAQMGALLQQQQQQLNSQAGGASAGNGATGVGDGSG
ncbi:hypothetical protein HDU96_006958 [Phlyctochytrium bullatum]|nr:hypothetical protein HDU96_006958 [Phlyctochytrium bullatum]